MGLRYLPRLLFALALLPSAAAAAEPPDLSGKDLHWAHGEKADCWAFRLSPNPALTFTWTGTCKDKLIDGDGTLSWSYGRARGETYEGHFVAGRLEGRGKWNDAHGVHYEGQFQGSARSGAGTFSAYGMVDEGLFSGAHQYMNGPGKRTFSNGDVLTGNFVEFPP